MQEVLILGIRRNPFIIAKLISLDSFERAIAGAQAATTLTSSANLIWPPDATRFWTSHKLRSGSEVEKKNRISLKAPCPLDKARNDFSRKAECKGKSMSSVSRTRRALLGCSTSYAVGGPGAGRCKLGWTRDSAGRAGRRNRVIYDWLFIRTHTHTHRVSINEQRLMGMLSP